MRRFRLTPTAAANFERIGRETAERWGDAQAGRYLSDLRDGFQYVADRYDRLPRKPTGVGDLRLHRVNRHYIVFLELTAEVVAVTTILHEHVDVPTRLRNAHSRTNQEVADLRRRILKDNLSSED